MSRAAILGAVGSLLLVYPAAAAPHETARQSCQAQWTGLRGTSAAAGWTQSRFISDCLRRRHAAGHANAAAPTGPVLAAAAAAAGVSAAVVAAAGHSSEKPASP